MQGELDSSHPQLDIQIIGINEVGRESANGLMTAGRTLPWLQDVDANNNQASDVWREQWNVVYRDVVIVDKDLTELGAFNLTTYDLANNVVYQSLREILIDVASDQPFWQAEGNVLDVNEDGVVSAVGDVLPCINEINQRTFTDNTGILPALRLPEVATKPHVDVNGDGYLSAQADILPIINFLNRQSAGEGEGEGAAPEVARAASASDGAPASALDLPTGGAWWNLTPNRPTPASEVAQASAIALPRTTEAGNDLGRHVQPPPIGVTHVGLENGAAWEAEQAALANVPHDSTETDLFDEVDGLSELVDLLAFGTIGVGSRG